jgi:hypothetical protein
MQQSLELTPDSYQNETQGFVFFHRIQCSGGHNIGSAITTHGVNCDGDRLHRSSISHWRVDLLATAYSSLASITCLPR